MSGLLRAGERVTPLHAMALAITLLGLLGFARVLLAPPPEDLTLHGAGSGHWSVASVPVGGPAWNAGVRPGWEVIGIEPPGADPGGGWSSVLLTDGRIQLGLQRDATAPPPEPLIVAAVFFAAALAARAVSLPNVSWFLTLAALGTTVVNLAPLTDPPANAAALLAGPLCGFAFAADARGMLGRRPVAFAGIVAAVAAVLVAWSFAARFGDWPLVVAMSEGDTAVLVVLGTGMIWVGAGRRALARDPGTRLPPSVLVGLLVDELVPGRSRTQLSAIERERRRLAADLHAEVLPSLSAVIRDVEQGTPVAEASARLRKITDELREMMSERRIPVLEELGLLAALEWLAERIESRTGVIVQLHVEGSRGAGTGRPPRDVEVAVFRIAQLALDNALVHARPRVVRVRVDADAGHVELELSDDGPGLAPDAEVRAVRSGRLGLADMRQRAASIGAALSIHGRPGRGTSVTVRWPA